MASLPPSPLPAGVRVPRKMPRRCVLVGPPASGKTSLLMQHAFNLAALGRSVLFVCSQQQLERRPPAQPRATWEAAGETTDQHSRILRRIQIKYVNDESELFLFLSAIQLGAEAPPDDLLIDDLDTLCIPSGGGGGLFSPAPGSRKKPPAAPSWGAMGGGGAYPRGTRLS